ncbi:MAG: SpoIVB peptidase [Eubacteriales bacterium]|nr:SpoIVB peptidase [Eubacteriales bacterium]
MRRYKNLLKLLLVCNFIFILVVAKLGFDLNQEQSLLEVSHSISSQKNNHAQSSTKKVIAVGKTVGIYVNTNGILVIDTGEVTDEHGALVAPSKDRLIPGDYIFSLNHENVHTKKELIDKIMNCSGETLIFGVKRNNEKIEVAVQPVETELNTYKVGIWVRDDLQGLGTVTYIDDSHFGALGHSINDTDTGKLLNVSDGQLYEANIFGLKKGKSGEPGVIEGMITYDTNKVVGSIDTNSNYGIFGYVDHAFVNNLHEKEIEVADKKDVKKGEAYIQSYVSGEKKQYKIEITDIRRNKNGDMEMELKVKDKALLSLTGGIIQGMSGSPVLQNGRIVGAVTHVFVDDPTRGYAIFIEEMLEDN